jgi:hypothetical protein
MARVSWITFVSQPRCNSLARTFAHVATFWRCSVSVQIPSLCLARVARPRRFQHCNELNTMHRSKLISLSVLIALSCACSDQAPPPAASEPAKETTSATPSLDTDPNAMRAKLNAGGIPSEYAAHFENSQLVRISELRQSADAGSRAGEYTFNGARLLAYRGAKLSDSAALDLRFDMQGTLHSRQGADVTEEDVSAIRGRAQLLRSHALAQRATRSH